MITDLLPPGRLWLLEAGNPLYQTLLALSDEPGRVEGRGNDLINESDPRTANETLSDWERVIGLPDTIVTTIPSTTAGRQQAITQKLQRQGAQTAAFYISLAASCGYPGVTIQDTYGSTILRSGFLSGSRCWGEQWAYVWQMTVPAPTGTALTHAQLQAVIQRAAPAHTTAIFAFL